MMPSGWDAIPNTGAELAGTLASRIEDEFAEKVSGEPAPVRPVTSGVLLETVELDRQVAVVASVADEFEDAAVREPASSAAPARVPPTFAAATVTWRR